MSVSVTARIDPSANLANDAVIGHFAVIGAGVQIGNECRIGHHVVIHAGTVVGNDVRIDDHAVLGKQPMRAVRSATTSSTELPPARIGSGSLIGAGAVLYAGCDIGQRVLVADCATIRERVDIGDETIVGRGVAIENDCSVGMRCKLETNAYICAHTTIGDDVFIAPGVLTSNDNFMGRTEERKERFAGPTIRNGARLGVGSVILPGRDVPPEAVIAAGAVLTRDAEAGQIHQGVPARAVREVPPEQRLDANE